MITGLEATPLRSTVVPLNDVTLTCESTSTIYIPERYFWHRINGIVPLDATGQNTNRLTLHKVVPADQGLYYCMGSVYGHCGVSNNVMVIVKGMYKEVNS